MDAIYLDSLHNTTIITEKKTDVLLHLLAHYDINNVASNFDKDYVKYISNIKNENTSSLQKELKENDDENLDYLSFMPAFFNSIDSLFKGLAFLSQPSKVTLTGFTETEVQCLQLLQNVYANSYLLGLVKFTEIVKSEYERFYSSYWDSKKESYAREMLLFRKIWETEENDKILAFLRTHGVPAITVYLSEGMRRNGRGIRTNDSSVCSITRMPTINDEVFESYYIAVHELLHQVIDGITQSILEIDSQQRSLNPDDDGYNIHEQIENSVIFAQHLLMGTKRKIRTKEYYALVSEIGNTDIKNKSDFLAHFRLDGKIQCKLESIII